MASVCVFRRVEKKYIVTTEQMEMLKKLFAHILRPDKYEKYTLCNVYYDTENSDLIRRSIDKPAFKEKMRLRSYGVPTEDQSVFLEIKRKYDGTVYKRRIEVSYGEAIAYLENGGYSGDGQIFDEIGYFRSLYDVIPKMFISYDRTAFCGINDSSLRLTFDSNIRYRTSELSLSCGDGGEPLTDPDLHIMEIKANEAMPREMADILCQKGIYPSPFSKYGRAYIKETKKERL